MKSTRLRPSPARALTTQELIYPMSCQAGQLVPLCSEPALTSEGVEEPFASASDLMQRSTNDLRTIEQLRRRRERIARAFLRLRRQHAPGKAQHALRRKLCRLCLRQTEAVEVWHE